MAGDQFTKLAHGLCRDHHVLFKAKGLFGLVSTHHVVRLPGEIGSVWGSTRQIPRHFMRLPLRLLMRHLLQQLLPDIDQGWRVSAGNQAF
ncbi:hypothetical protein ACWGQ5_55630 [Streptomyces sp. NPDC055722]|jgi:hypothetical protein